MTKKPPSRSTSRDLQRYAGLFASRTRVMTSSAMRDMMAITARPEVISLAGGLADTSSFPASVLADITTKIAREQTARALQYGPTDGMPEVKQTITEVMAAEGMRVDADDLVVTTGGQQVLDLVAKTLIDPGDVIVAEGPSYPGALSAFKAYQAEVVQIDMDSDGMRVDLMEEALDRLEREGKRPKFIYTVPTFQNPGGVTLSLPRRRRLVEVAHERELLVLEDSPYGMLRFEGDPLPSIYELDGGVFAMYLGTFSKIFSPGVRVGWVVAPPPVLEKINLGKQEGDLCSSTLSQLVVTELVQSGYWRNHIETVIGIYRERRDALLSALSDHFPHQAEWTEPAGGLFVWATLPDFIDTTDLLARALQDNVAFVPGEGAFTDGRGRSSMRLNYSGSDSDEIREGVRRIGKVVQEQVELYGTLTGEIARPDSATAESGGALEPGANVVSLPERRDRDRRAQ